MLTKIKRAQSTAEYAILLALVVAAAMGKRKSGKPTVEAEVKVRSVKEAIKEETKEDKEYV